MRRTLIICTILVLSGGPCAGAVEAKAVTSLSYASRFRAAYLPVFRSLNSQTSVCQAVSRVQQLPACGKQIAPFRLAVARFLQFLTHTPPPAKARADIRALVTATKVLQQRFTTLAGIIKQKDLARFKAMGGLGHPIDRAIQAFVSAIGLLVLDDPGLKVPLPG
jgi:hypothetical protein